MKLDLKLGAQVICTDQPSGKLVELVVDPATHQVTDLVVQKGLLNKQRWIAPLTTIEQVTSQAIHLNLHSDQLHPDPETSTPEHRASTTALEEQLRRETLVTTHTVINAKTPVRTPHGDFGTLEQVVLDGDNGQISQLIIRKGLFPKSFIVPEEAIDQISTAAILVKLSQEEIAALPPARSRRDEDMVAELQQRLQEGWPAFTGVMATCTAGKVRLIGYVRSKPLWYHAAELAQLVAGVTDVQNDLVVDPDFVPDEGAATVDLARQVHHALLADSQTATAVIDVTNEQETIILQGKVASEAIRQRAEAIARQQPGVNAVENHLTVAQAEAAPKLHYG